MKFKKPGKFLQAKFRYLKENKKYRSVEDLANDLGYTRRGIVYMIFSGECIIQLKDMALYKKAFNLTEAEVERLVLLVCYNKADNIYEKRIFRGALKVTPKRMSLQAYRRPLL